MKDLKISFEQLNTLYCDECGYTASLPLVEVMDDMPIEEMKHVVQSLFFAVKRTFADQGWATSVGYDLCADCCKSMGIVPGYNENGLLPEVVVMPRSHEEKP